MASQNSLRLCTFNCRSVKNSVFDVQKLCDSYDIIFLQEHWLLPFELSILSNIHNDFLAFGTSAVNVRDDLITGRPYGGTAVLYRKTFARFVNIVDCREPRMCAAKVTTREGPVLFVNVYMPTDTNDDYSCDEYVDMYMKISSVFSAVDAIYIVIAGDFNCRQGSRFNDVFHKFLHDEQLTCVDMLLLNGVFTYLSNDGQHMSWIDHIVCSRTMLPYVTDIGVLQDKLCSDHMPLYASFQSLIDMNCSADEPSTHSHGKKYCDWSRASCNDLERYKLNLSAGSK